MRNQERERETGRENGNRVLVAKRSLPTAGGFAVALLDTLERADLLLHARIDNLETRGRNVSNAPTMISLETSALTLYLPLTPFGRPAIPRFGPRATTSLVSGFLVLPALADRARTLAIEAAFSFSVNPFSSSSLIPCALAFIFSRRRIVRIFLRALASATFLIGRAFSSRCLSRMAWTASLVIGML